MHTFEFEQSITIYKNYKMQQIRFDLYSLMIIYLPNLTNRLIQFWSKKKMGASEPQPVNINKEQLRNSHPFLQKSYIVREPTKNYIQSTYPIQQKYYQSWRNNVAHTAGYPNGQFAFLPTEMGYTPSTQMCAKHGNVITNYPNYPYILSDEITRRQPNREYFKEKQLYYLLYALVAAKIDAKQRGQPLGDIKPENVFLSRDEKIKVGTLQSFPYEKSSYNKLIDTSKPSSNVLVAPEDLTSASSKLLDNKTNSKSEQFSIGATVLSAGILDDLHSVYNYSGRGFDIDTHRQKTTEWCDHPYYSEMLKSIVLTLVHPDVQRRISVDELWAFLTKHQTSILSKEQFVVNTLPEKLEQGVAIIHSKLSP